MDHNESDSASVMTKSQAADPWQTPRSIASEIIVPVDSSPFLKKSHPSVSGRTEWRSSIDGSQARKYSSSTRKADVAIGTSYKPEQKETSKLGPLSRKEILNKDGCQPRGRTEEAVCDGNHGALMAILNKKKGFWRSSMRKRGRQSG